MKVAADNIGSNIDHHHVVTHNGFRFNKKCEDKIGTLYWCVFNRSSRSICSARLKMYNDVVIEELGDHEDYCN